MLTTNVDGQVRRAFAPERTWLFQGDLAFLQCGQPCCDELWSADAFVRRALNCPRCGWLMAPWVRDETFLEGSFWRAQRRRYEAFVRDALSSGARVLFLELGVGGMTPGVIELPFWDMTARNDNAFYLRVNYGKAGEPRQLGERSLTVCADIADVMDRVCALLGAREEER